LVLRTFDIERLIEENHWPRSTQLGYFLYHLFGQLRCPWIVSTIVPIAWSAYFGIKRYVTVEEQRSSLVASEATAH
jgi:hypothetical protein